MLICWNAEGVHGQKKVGNPCSTLFLLQLHCPVDAFTKALMLIQLWVHTQGFKVCLRLGVHCLYLPLMVTKQVILPVTLD